MGFFKKLGRDIRRGSNNFFVKGKINGQPIMSKGNLSTLSNALGSAGTVAGGVGTLATLTGNPEIGVPLLGVAAGLGAGSKIAGGASHFAPNAPKTNRPNPNPLERSPPPQPQSNVPSVAGLPAV